MKKLIITAAVNGGITSRTKNRNVPYLPEEIAQAVYDSWNAGAAVAHIHARNSDGTPCYTFEAYRDIINMVRDKCDILINFSTSTFNLPSDKPHSDAWSHLKLRPDIASFNCGSVNHGGRPFINHPETAKQLARDLTKYNVKPEIEVYHGGVIGEALELRKNGSLASPLLFTFAMGIQGGWLLIARHCFI